MSHREPFPISNLRPHNCEKYPSCNANICPLDPDWRKRTYIKGEAICYYMLEAQKPDVCKHFQGTIELQTLQSIDEHAEVLKGAYSPIRKRLDIAKATRFRRGVDE